MKRLLTLGVVLFFSSVDSHEAERLTVTLASQQIEMGGNFRSCIEGLEPGMSADVWYRRPNFRYPEVQFDWQQQACESHTLNTGWNKDVGVWEIVAVRLHKRGVYNGEWQNTAAKLEVVPDEKLRPEFEWLARRRAETNAAAIKLLSGAILFITFFGLLPALLVQRLIGRKI